MKIKNMSSFVCAVAFLGTATVAMAGAYGEPGQAEEMPRSAPAAEVAPSDDFAPFAYGSLGALYAGEFFTNGAKQEHNSYGWGLSARAGYRFHENVAAELLYEHVIEFDADNGTDRRAFSLMPNIKVFPIQGFCEPYLSVGAGLVGVDNQHNVRGDGANTGDLGVEDGYGFGMRFGIGADFYATEQIYLEPEVAYVLPLTSDVNEYQYLTAGLSIGYAFN